MIKLSMTKGNMIYKNN